MSSRDIKDIRNDDGRKTGVTLNMPREQYAAIPRMNFSSLKAGLLGSFDIDPVMIRETFEETRPAPTNDQQDSFNKGTLAHLILLQPELLVDRVAVWQGRERRGQSWDAFSTEHRGKMIMRECDVRAVQHACREFRQVPEVRDLLRPCDTEVAVCAKVGEVYCKGLLDAVTRDGLCVMIDPKTTSRGIDDRSVKYAISDFKYREQMGFYSQLYQLATGREIEQVYLLFISLPPQRIGIRLVRVTTSALQWGWSRCLQALERVEECIRDDRWPTFFANDIADVSEFEIGDVELKGFED